MKRYKEGSIWRKWDLHIHSNASDGKMTCQEIIDKAIERGIKVIALTDHHTVKNIDSIKEYAKDKDIEVISGVEFRTEYGDKSVHILALFPNLFNGIELNSKNLEDLILNPLNLVEATIIQKGRNKLIEEGKDNIDITNDFAFKKGIFLVQVDFKKTADIVHKYGGIIIPHAGTKENSIDKEMKHEGKPGTNLYNSLGPVKEELFNNGYIDICEIRKENDNEKFYLEKFGKPSIITSDAHKIEEVGSRYTWIKADPTFEGLKQIIFEPSERVRIQEDNPAKEYEKPYLAEIKMLNDEQIFVDDDLVFKANDGIPLNQSLVTIIGGRGEGKSMLTDYIASGFVGQQHNKEGEFSKEGNVHLVYSKTNQNHDETITFPITNEKHGVDFIYINQGRLKDIVEPKEKASLANSIRKLAKLEEPLFNAELNQTVIDKISYFHQLVDYFNIRNEEGELVNSIAHLESQEKSVQEFISNITTAETKDKLSKYSESIKLLNGYNQKKEQLHLFKNKLVQTIGNLNSEINNINGEKATIPLLENDLFLKQIEAIDKWILEIDSYIALNHKTIDSIKEEFKDYKGDLSTLLNDVNKFEKNLFEIRNKLKEVRDKEQERDNLQKALFVDVEGNSCFVSQIKEDYIRQKTQLESEWNKFKQIEQRDELNPQQKEIMSKLLENLSIEVVIDFNIHRFYNEISPSIDGSKWRAKNNFEAKQRRFEINNFDSFFNFIKNKYIEEYYCLEFYENFMNIFWDEAIRKKYISVYPILKYHGKDLNKLSVGQKGTVYLKMMLATEAFSKPIIFDQPEDDLDNMFIIQELIDLFKKLKKYRQVIIVTHNANLVVNADAEQVIVAKNDEGKLTYQTGSLENEEINKKVCEILEGGRDAFMKRELKYSINK